MNVPPGMGAAEYAEQGLALMDPAEIQAIRDWAWKRFGSRPTVLNGGIKRERRPRPPSIRSGRASTTIGLPSPGISEHGQSAKLRKVTATVINNGPARMSVVSNRASSGTDVGSASRPSGAFEKPSSRHRSKTPCGVSKARDVSTRVTRSKAQAISCFVQLDRCGKRAVEAESYAGAPKAPGLTEGALQKLAGNKKRKRDLEDEPAKKHRRIANTQSQLMEDTTITSHNGSIDVARIQGWIVEQDADYEQMKLPSIPLDLEIPRPISQDEHITSRLMEREDDPVKVYEISGSHQPLTSTFQGVDAIAPCNKIAATETAISPSATLTSAPRAKQQMGAAASRRSALKVNTPPKITKPSQSTKPKKSMRNPHSMKVETLLCAYEATNAYCKALGLKQKVAEASKLLLHDVFEHEFFESLPRHALIAGCIIFACNHNHISKPFSQVFSQAIPKRECGKTMLALHEFFDAPDRTKLGKFSPEIVNPDTLR